MINSALALASLLAAGPVLEVPWPCEQTFSCTQGNGGQASHTGYAQYAWDFGMPLGTDVVAARGGTVSRIRMDSMIGGCSNDYANDANYIVIDHGDDTAALYLHLEGFSSNLQQGSPVEAGDVIARVGLTGWTCGPHLHFQVQEVCDSWWCQSVESEFFAAGTIQYTDQVQSENCGPCTATLAGGQTTLSESVVQCFDRLTSYWWNAGQGLDGHHWYTLATPAQQPETLGRWRFEVDVPGNYEVEVHIPNANADASGATYAIHHGGAVDHVGLNQGAQKGWQSLGTFYFGQNGDSYIELPDNTGDDGPALAYDSVRLSFVDQGGDGDGDPDPTGDGDGDPDPTTGTTTGPATGDGDGDECFVGEIGCYCTDGGGCDPGGICVDGFCVPEGGGPGGGSGGSGGSGGETGGETGDSGSGSSGGETGGQTSFGGDDGLDYIGEGGCACSAPGAGEGEGRGGLAAMALLALAGLLRRRDL